MADPLADRLERCYSAAVYDVLRAMAYPNQVLPSEIRPLEPSYKLAGRVYTVSGRVDETKTAHETLLAWTGLLSKAPKDSVLICQPHTHSMALMGELSAETLQFRGVRGYIVDGACRDSAFISSIGFKVFCSSFTPVDVVGRWFADAYAEPIRLGDVTIVTGDYVLADRDGIVIIPMAIAEEVVSKTEEVLQTESLIRKAILAGLDPQEAYLKYGKF